MKKKEKMDRLAPPINTFTVKSVDSVWGAMGDSTITQFSSGCEIWSQEERFQGPGAEGPLQLRGLRTLEVTMQTSWQALDFGVLQADKSKSPRAFDAL